MTTPINPNDPYSQQYQQQRQYQQAPQGYQQPGPGYYPPQHGGQPPRRRHTGRNVLLSALGVLVIIIVASVLATAGNAPTVSTGASSPAAGSTPKTATKTTARIGSTISLAGQDAGEKMAVKLVRVLRRARGTDYSTPGRGRKFMAVQIRLTDTGTVAYSDAPDNSAVLIDSKGQSYDATVATVARCQSFGGTENIATGASGLGCVVFEVPRHVKITGFQFTLDSGMASDTGQWLTSK